ncbi:MAG TPA: DUF5678 domain-containing protein [Solirubrobacteraceae bacterium]|nr:DUF5678 domain-containing protein [Solirubrobacteraceae bacterium]
MAVKEIQREQARSIPHIDLSSYAGQWVAIRGDKVVASDLDAVALRNRPEVEETDTLLPVPDASADLLLL